MLVLLLAVACAQALGHSQSLAELAKQEELRRKSIGSTGKVYTNEDLRRDITATAPPSGNATPAQPPSTQVPSVNLPGGRVDDAEAGEVKDEKYWRERIAAARATLERSRVFADALQTRLNSLAADIVNRDDPAQRAQLELERQRALAELDRVTKETAEQAKAIADIEEEARKSNVPPGWLRPPGR